MPIPPVAIADVPELGGVPPAQGPQPPKFNLESLTLGLEAQDASTLREDKQTYEESVELYRYARKRNEPTRREFDTLIDFAFGKQFLFFGDKLDHMARPKRNGTWDTIRHKKGLVTEPPLQIEVLPRHKDAWAKADLVKAALDQNAERRDAGGMNRKDKIDLLVSWGALCGTGLIHQGWDPHGNETAERIVDPRMFDPDPDHAMQSEWLYCFETLRLPLGTIRRIFPATGSDVAPDSGQSDVPIRAPWAPASDGDLIRLRRGSGQEIEEEFRRPDYATVVFMWSQGHLDPKEAEQIRHFLRCKTCAREFRGDPYSPDVSHFGPLPIDSGQECPACGFGELASYSVVRGTNIPGYPKGRRLVVFAPLSHTLLYKGRWSTPELRYWPYKAFRWYIDPRRFWGVSEVQFQWSLQLLVNKMLVLLTENATHNATPKVIIPKGIGFENKPWTNIPSEKLIASDPRFIQAMRAFQTGDVGNSLIFLTQLALRELREQGGFGDVAQGNIRSNTELSGRAIERAQSAAEVPVRDHLRQRYMVETQIAQDDLEMIRERWTTERPVRLQSLAGEREIEWLKGEDMPEADVMVTADPQRLIDRAQIVDVAIKLLSTPDPETGLPMIDAEAAAAWIGIPQVLRGVRERRRRSRLAEEAKAQAGGQAQGQPLMQEPGELDALAQALAEQGMAAGIGPGGI